MNHILWPQDQPTRELVGGKAAALAKVQTFHSQDHSIPPWFVLSSQAFFAAFPTASDTASVTASVTSIQNAADSAARDAILSRLKSGEFEIPPVLEEEIAAALRIIAPAGELVAVRSSGIDEDGSDYSFAGQFTTFLNVAQESVAERIFDVWLSGYTQQLADYQRERAGEAQEMVTPPAVLIQRMVNADCSGVAFSMDPVSGRRNVAVVGAIHGLGEALVSGEAEGDTYHVERSGEITMVSTARDGVAVLTDTEVTAIAALARQTARHFGTPQDIEWAKEDDQLYLLQSRPITNIAHLVDPEGVANLWDNSNIAESYPGLTTPLTFSFVRHAYEHVYRHFCRMMNVSEPILDKSEPIFRGMLGYINGRIYYNLLNWYRLLALLPGYTLNRSFMEEMMGVGEPLPRHLHQPQAAQSFGEKVAEFFRIGICMGGLVKNYLLLPRQTRRFYQRLDQLLGSERPDFSTYRPSGCVSGGAWHQMTNAFLLGINDPSLAKLAKHTVENHGKKIVN